MSWRPRQLTRSQLAERRLGAGRLLQASQLSQAAMARQMGVSRAAVSRLGGPRRASQGHRGGLHKRRVPGRPPRLPPAPWPHLRHILGRGARQASVDTERRTRRRIRAGMLVAFGVAYHAHELSLRLTTLGWSPQHPAVDARVRDEALVQAWLTQDWPRINQRPAAAARRSSSSMQPASPVAPRPARLGLRGGTRRASGV
jgi:hypothetical protein